MEIAALDILSESTLSVCSKNCSYQNKGKVN